MRYQLAARKSSEVKQQRQTSLISCACGEGLWYFLRGDRELVCYELKSSHLSCAAVFYIMARNKAHHRSAEIQSAGILRAGFGRDVRADRRILTALFCLSSGMPDKI